MDPDLLPCPASKSQRKTTNSNSHLQTKTETNRKACPHTSSQRPFQKSVTKCTAIFLPQIQVESKKKLYQQPQPRDATKRSLPEHPALSVGCLSITLSTSRQIFTTKNLEMECTHTQKKEECPHLSNIFHSKLCQTTQATQKDLKTNSQIPRPRP